MVEHKWLTPEEIEAKKQRKKLLMYIALPVAAIVLGGVIPVILN
ncbi:hypothetical protein [Bacillus kexueae]|nr:hypothetical protein [Bacillus kexueae]